MKKIGVKEVPVKNPKRIIKPIELPPELMPSEKPIEIEFPMKVPAVPIEVPRWQSQG
jgi:hypothetical protein